GKSTHAVVAAHVGAPLAADEFDGLPHIDVMIAGYEGYVLCGPQSCEPVAAAQKLGRQRDVGDISCDSDMSGRLLLQVGDNCRQRARVVHETPLALPIDIAGPPFSDELAPMRCGQRRKMRVGKMGKDEHRSGSSPLGAADQYAGEEHKDPTYDDLEGGLQEWRVHEARADPGDYTEFDCHHDHGDGGRRHEMWNQVGQSVAKS